MSPQEKANKKTSKAAIEHVWLQKHADIVLD